MLDTPMPNHLTLHELVNKLGEGRYVIPDFQREFEWEPWDICELIRSIFQDYYIGSLLLWKGTRENFDAFSCESIYGYEGAGSPEFIVLDGQQRLTALYYAFFAPDKPLPKRQNRAFYFINVDKFMAEEYEEAFNYEWKTRRLNKVLNDTKLQYQAHIFPLAIIGDRDWSLPNWVQGYEQFWREIGNQEYAENAKAFGNYLKSIIFQYQISFIELDRNICCVD